MKRALLICCLVVCSVTNIFSQDKEIPKLTGPYLGQKPPGLTPEIFAPEIFLKSNSVFNATFSPDGKEFYFSVNEPSGRETMKVMKFMNGGWQPQESPSFISRYNDCDPFFSHDGKRLYFISTRSKTKGEESGDWDIWYVERTNTGWSEPVNVGPPVNSGDDEYYVSLTKEGTIYFASNRVGGYGSFDIFQSKFINGQYITPQNLGPAINTEALEHDPFITPDESILIFTSVDRFGAYGMGDLYISFRQKDGTWTKAKNMGEVFNTINYDFCPIFSPDGKYFFFTRGGDIFWVSTKIIEELRPNK